jgi:hypothetical protein
VLVNIIPHLALQLSHGAGCLVLGQVGVDHARHLCIYLMNEAFRIVELTMVLRMVFNSTNDVEDGKADFGAAGSVLLEVAVEVCCCCAAGDDQENNAMLLEDVAKWEVIEQKASEISDCGGQRDECMLQGASREDGRTEDWRHGRYGLEHVANEWDRSEV